MWLAIPKHVIRELIQEQIEQWQQIGGGANLDAFEFDPKQTNPELLRSLGYYDNVEAWVAGIQVKKLSQFLLDLDKYPQTWVNQ